MPLPTKDTFTERDERLWSGYTCEVCGWFELRPGDHLWCPHCERLGRGRAFTMKQVNVVPAGRLEAAEAALRECLYAAHGNDAANNAVKRIVTEAFGGRAE